MARSLRSLLPLTLAPALLLAGCTERELPTALAPDAASGIVSAATVCTGDRTLRDQADVNAFGCSEVTGNLTIGQGGDITDLSPLTGLTSVGGELLILRNPGLTSLVGLENVTSAGRTTIRDNDALTSLAGLGGLVSVTRLHVEANDALTSLAGLENLASVSEYLLVEQNPNLASIAALARLSSSGGLASAAGLSIVGSEVLTSLTGLENLSSVGGQLRIHGNSALASLEELGNLTTVGGTFFILGNAALTSPAGLESLTSVGDLHVSANDALVSLTGIEGLSSLAGELYIGGNRALTSLAGLEGFTFIGNQLTIDNNDALASLAGLENLTSVGGRVRISDNAALVSVAGLENLTSVGTAVPVGELIIRDNPVLPSLAGLRNLTAAGNNLIIRGNGALRSLAGMEELTSVTGGLIIEQNGALSSLAGLERIGSVGFLWIRGNAALTSLNGLQNLTSVANDLRIENNPVLNGCACGLAGLISSGAFTGVGGPVTIANNAPGGGCNSPAEVLAAPCPVVPVPVITIGAEPQTLWPPNRKYTTTALSGLGLTVTDPSDPSLSADDVVIASVWSDEPEHGPGDATRNDIVIAADCRAVQLRAERREVSNGRVYTLRLAVTNAAGGTGTAEYRVFVPVGRWELAVDDGAAAGYVVAGSCGG